MTLPRSDPHCTAFAYSLPPSDTVVSASDWETGRIWEEAGFTPPLPYRGVVEILHRLAMGEETEIVPLALAIARAPCDDARCRITDPAQLRRAARQFGISTAGRTDEAIARDVADAVIDEYAAPHHHSAYRSRHT